MRVIHKVVDTEIDLDESEQGNQLQVCAYDSCFGFVSCVVLFQKKILQIEPGILRGLGFSDESPVWGRGHQVAHVMTALLARALFALCLQAYRGHDALIFAWSMCRSMCVGYHDSFRFQKRP